jgi:hypothetical protein
MKPKRSSSKINVSMNFHKSSCAKKHHFWSKNGRRKNAFSRKNAARSNNAFSNSKNDFSGSKMLSSIKSKKQSKISEMRRLG